MISAVPPDEYGNRFLNFLLSIIRGANLALRPRMEWFIHVMATLLAPQYSNTLLWCCSATPTPFNFYLHSFSFIFGITKPLLSWMEIWFTSKGSTSLSSSGFVLSLISTRVVLPVHCWLMCSRACFFLYPLPTRASYSVRGNGYWKD